MDTKAVKKIKTLKNNSNDNLERNKGDGYVVKIAGKVIEDFELNDQELEFHFKVALSILESSKNRLKTNYANYFNMEYSVLPNIHMLLKDFGILKDLCELFESIAKADFNDVMDEFDEIYKQIGVYREGNKLMISDDELENRKAKEFTKDDISKRNADFLNKPSQKSYKTNNRGLVKQSSDNHSYYISPSDIFKDYFFFEDFDDTITDQFYRGRYIYKEFIAEEIRKRAAEQEVDKVVNLTYRDRNYYYLKKVAVKKKKIKKEVKAIIVNESINAAKKKKKKKSKKKKPDAQENGSETSIISDIENPVDNQKITESKAATNLNIIPNIKNDINCGILEIKITKMPIIPISRISVSHFQKDTDNSNAVIGEKLINGIVDKDQEKAETKNDIISKENIHDIKIPTPVEDALANDQCLTHHEKSFSAKPPIRKSQINLIRAAQRKLRDRSEGNIISDDNKRSFTLNSDYNPSTDIIKRYSDYSNTNNHSLIREISIQKSNHIIHHKRREKTRKKNNRTIEKKLKNKEMSIERRFNKLTERKARCLALGDIGDVPDLVIRKDSEDRLTVSDARHEFMERVAGILEVAVDPENDNKIFQVMNKSLQEEFEWIREEKNHIVKERRSIVSNRLSANHESDFLFKGFNNGKSVDFQEEFLEMIKREKLNDNNIDKDIKVPTEKNGVNNQLPEKANKKKKKKKKKKTKQVEESIPVLEKQNDFIVPLKEPVNLQTSLDKNLPLKQIRDSINKQGLAFDIIADVDEKNEFIKMFEILESQTKRGLGPDMDKKLHSVVEGDLKSAREKQVTNRRYKTADSSSQKLNAI